MEDGDRRTYLGMVTAMDEAVGGVVRSLRQHSLYDNTVIIWLSDNGGLVPSPGPGGGSASNWPLR